MYYRLLIIAIIGILGNIKLISQDESTIGLFGAASFKPTYYLEHLSYTTGARVGIVWNHNLSFSLSLNATTIANPTINYFDTTYSANPHIDYIYYGGDVEYFLNPDKELHPSFSLFIGRGRTNLTVNTGTKDLKPVPYTEYSYFLLLEPSINLNLNYKPFYRICLGLGYKRAIGAEFKPTGAGIDYSDKELSGIFAHLTIKFGNF